MRQPFVCPLDVNMSEESKERKTQALSGTSSGIDQQVCAEKTKYMGVSCATVQHINHNLLIDN
jgi:hypothetical protein